MEKLKEEILDLISLKQEGAYWDFKKEWYDEKHKQDLLHDIICMSNNLINKDAYIIIGVDEENNYEIVDMKEDSNRKNTQNIVDFLKDKKFAGDIRPTVVVRTIEIQGNQIDIIVVKNSTNTPFYLKEKYLGVYSNQIYTRIQDTNTPLTSSADIDKVEWLWKKRFGLDLSPLEKAVYLLSDVKKWLPVGTDGVHTSFKNYGEFYHKQHPEFTIKYQLDESRFKQGMIDEIERDIYWMNELPRKVHNSYLYLIDVKYNSTILYSTLAVFADSFRFNRTLWKKEYLFKNNSGEYIFYCYIEKNSIEFMLDNWLCNSYDTIKQIKENKIVCSTDQSNFEYKHSPYDVILIFDDEQEHECFKNYMKSKQVDFLIKCGDYSCLKNKNKKHYAKNNDSEYIEYICNCGKKLNQWLAEWRNNND